MKIELIFVNDLFGRDAAYWSSDTPGGQHVSPCVHDNRLVKVPLVYSRSPRVPHSYSGQPRGLNPRSPKSDFQVLSRQMALVVNGHDSGIVRHLVV